jgi:hypothetical protein
MIMVRLFQFGSVAPGLLDPARRKAPRDQRSSAQGMAGWDAIPAAVRGSKPAPVGETVPVGDLSDRLLRRVGLTQVFVNQRDPDLPQVGHGRDTDVPLETLLQRTRAHPGDFGETGESERLAGLCPHRLDDASDCPRRRQRPVRIAQLITIRVIGGQQQPGQQTLLQAGPDSRVVDQPVRQGGIYTTRWKMIPRELCSKLRTGRPIRKNKRHTVKGQWRSQIIGARPIDDRPASANDRTELGHLEGDLIIGSKNSQVATLVDRKSRYPRAFSKDGRW